MGLTSTRSGTETDRRHNSEWKQWRRTPTGRPSAAPGQNSSMWQADQTVLVIRLSLLSDCPCYQQMTRRRRETSRSDCPCYQTVLVISKWQEEEERQADQTVLVISKWQEEDWKVKQTVTRIQTVKWIRQVPQLRHKTETDKYQNSDRILKQTSTRIQRGYKTGKYQNWDRVLKQTSTRVQSG